jgi:hypothetical protein
MILAEAQAGTDCLTPLAIIEQNLDDNGLTADEVQYTDTL